MVAPSDGSKANSSSSPQRLRSFTRTDIDAKVERVLDLAGHYRQWLEPAKEGREEERNHVLGQIEQILKECLPAVLHCKNPFLLALNAALGDRDSASRLLADVQLMQVRLECLQAVAAAEIAERLQAESIAAVTLREIRHWRTVQMKPRRMHDGSRFVSFDDRMAVWAHRMFWSSGARARPSMLGASIFLAVSCDEVAKTAHRLGLPSEAMKPAIRLALRLREEPDWTHIDGHDVVRVLDEQDALTREVEELLAEIDLRASQATAQPDASRHDAGASQQDGAAEQPPGVADAACRFSRNGDGWDLCFAGKQVFVKHVAGMRHIVELLIQPGTSVSATTLDGLEAGTAESEQAVVDKEALRAYRERLGELDADMATAKNKGDEQELEKLRNEKDDLLEEVKQAQFGSHTRSMKSAQSAATGRVRAAIGRALDAIKERHPQLWRHLEDSLVDRNGANPCYRPGSYVNWQVSL